MNDTEVWPGDCVELMGRIPDGSVAAIVTDPPYGIGYDSGSQSRGGRSAYRVEWSAIAGDDRPSGDWLVEAFRVLRDGGALYLCTRWDVEPEWRVLLTAAGFRVVQRLTWNKRASGKGDLRGTYAPTCEDVLFASKGRHTLNRRPSMLLDVGCVPTWERRHHPHQKPVALPRLLIEASTNASDLVLDPYCGSGSTLVACVKAGRRCIGIELNPDYAAVAERRVREAEMPLFDLIRTEE